MNRIISLVSMLVLTACAYSPQQITINPIIDTVSESYGNGRAIVVSVKDNREVKALGSRGGIYKDTSLITVANNMTEAIAKAAQAKLATQGFNTNSTDSEAANLTISVEELSYDLPEQSLGKKIQLKAVLKVVAVAGSETYTGQYRSNSERMAAFTPGMKKNEAMINSLLSETLERLFSDAKLKAFLSNI